MDSSHCSLWMPAIPGIAAGPTPKKKLNGQSTPVGSRRVWDWAVRDKLDRIKDLDN